MSRTRTTIAALLGLAAAGCLDTEQDFTLNPDGSGKVKIKAVGAPFQLDFGQKKTSPEESAAKAGRETLEKSQGVDAWKDVDCVVRDDGKLAFTGTAYFKDLKGLRLSVLGMQSDGPELGLQDDGKGGLVLELKGDKKGPKEKPEPVKLSDEQLKAKMREERAKYQQGKAFMESFLKELRLKTRVTLPGTVADAGLFKADGPSTVEIALDGKALLKTLDELMMDDAFMKKQLESGKDMNDGNPLEEEAFLEKMFGRKGAPRVVVKGPLKAAFDYEAEAAPAREGAEALRAKFGSKSKPAAPNAAPAKSGSFKSVKVGGARMVHFQDNERGIRPLNGGSEGLTFSIVAELPGAVLAVKEGELTRAVADTGENLLPEGEFERKIHFPQLTEDKTVVVFDAAFKLPPAKSKGVKELSGKIVYTVGGKVKETDLGLPALKKGAQGKAFGARVEKVAKGEFSGDTEDLELVLELEPDQVESAVFLDAAGKPLEVSRSGYMGGGDTTTFMFSIKGRFPASTKVVVKTFADLAQVEVPFTVKDVDLLGRAK
jgi:hypothetical protein